MTTLSFVFLILIVFSVYQLAVIFLNNREIRWLRETRLRTQTQDVFGRTRHKLLLLTIEGELKSDSVTFMFFYLMNTTVMRNPDSYQALSKMLQESFLGDGEKDDTNETLIELKKESENWSNRVREMVNDNDSAITDLMIYNFSILRGIYFVTKFVVKIFRLLPKVIWKQFRKRVRAKFNGFNSASKVLAKTNPSVLTFIETKAKLHQLAEHSV